MLKRIENFMIKWKTEVISFFGMFYAFLFTMPSLSWAAEKSTSIAPILKNVGVVAGSIVGVVMIFFLLKNVLKFVKGESSVKPIVKDILILLLVLGFIVVAMNIENLMGTFGGVANGMTNTVGNVGNEIF